MSDREEFPTGCVCEPDGPHIIWNTGCPVHGDFAVHLARRAAERREGQ